MLELIRPSLDVLPHYVAALERGGWSPDNERQAAAVREELERIKTDPGLFVTRLDDPEARGGPVTLPDGSVVPRLPALAAGSGMASSAAGSVFAGSPEPPLCRRKCSGTSALRWCPGSAAAATRRAPWRCS